MTSTEKAYEQIGEARDTLERAVHRYLRQSGWKRVCNTPGARWLWEKQLPDGRTVLVGMDSAVDMEEAVRE